MDYGFIKTIHILSATVLFGTGLGTAFFMWQATRSNNLPVIAHTSTWVVRADWLFTLPAIIVQPITGLWLMQLTSQPLSPWLMGSLGLYTLAGLCWLPVVWLQIRMQQIAAQSLIAQRPLATDYYRYANIWFWLGVPAFAAMVGVFFLMVLKPV